VFFCPDICRMSNFRHIDRDTGFLMPPSVAEWLPERHLARFVVEVVEGLDLRAMTGRYRGSGEASYHPQLLLGVVIYGYATGVFSSRKLERATYDSVAFRFIAANEHPDHDTIATFRRRFLKEIEKLFVQVLMLAREAKAAATGKKPGGRPPALPVEGPLPTDQVNLTDAESRIMPMPGGGFEQCYNAQAVVAAGSLLVVANDEVQAGNDKQQIEPMLGKLSALAEDLGKVETLLADTGYFSETNVEACVVAEVDPLIAMGRQPHHPPLAERFAPAPPPPESPTPVEAMAHRLKTPEGRKLYALRKHTPEPVFGIIKSVLGFRQFLLRGLGKVCGEWNLVTMAYNVKRLFALPGAV
jgi:transposase